MNWIDLLPRGDGSSDVFVSGKKVILSFNRLASNLILILVGLLIAVIILEIGMRIASVSYPNFYVADEYRGLALQPLTEGWYRREGGSYIQINSAGMRDREHVKQKPANTLRIAILGDSYAEAKAVTVEKTFWSVMEHELGSCEVLGDQNVEVINFGVSGYGTAQELLTLRHNVWDYSPDIVLLAFWTGNDVVDNSRELNQANYVPYFYYRDDELVLDNSFRDTMEFRSRSGLLPQLIDSSRVLQLLNEVRRSINQELRIVQANEVVRQQTLTFTRENISEVGLSDSIYLEPENPIWAEAWRVTEGLINLMRDEVAERDAEFLIVTLSNGVQVHPDKSVREEFMVSLGINELLYPDLRIKTLGELEGFSVLNLAQPFQAYAEEHQVFLHGFENTVLGKGHWNVEGHRLAGQMISQYVCENIIERE